MEVLYPRSGGLDVHEQSVVACARLMGGGKVQRIVETFGTTTRELLRLLEWLQGHGVTHVAMESTGVYWKPVWHLLEGNATLGLVVMLAMWMNLTVGSFAGAFVPIVLERFKVDPAIASSIFVTTFTDMVGFFLLLGMASKLLL